MLRVGLWITHSFPIDTIIQLAHELPVLLVWLPHTLCATAWLRPCIRVCSLAAIVFTQSRVTVLHAQFNYKHAPLFQAWHFKREACHHSWSSCVWERAHGLTLDSVYNREGNVAQRSSSLGNWISCFYLFLHMLITTESPEVFFKSNISRH